MNMKRLISLVAFFATVQSSAQQVNPVPDYTFANRMSAGRNTVTDTAAYFSIGPRYGAIRGMMPPMVVDTASVSGNKRNGLLIFSVQKNKFVYWDSVGVKWAEMAGTGGTAITGSGVAGYIPEFTTTTNLDSTSLYHSVGRFAIGSTTTSNGRFSVFGGQAYFDTSLKVGSQTLLADEGKSEVYVNTTSDSGAYSLQVGGSIFNTTDAVFARNSGNVAIGTTNILWPLSNRKNLEINGNSQVLLAFNISDTSSGYIWQNGNDMSFAAVKAGYIQFGTNGNSTRMRIKSDGEILVGSSTDAGAYTFQIAGSLYSTTSAVLAVSSGGISLGTTSVTSKTLRVANRGGMSLETITGGAGGYFVSTGDYDIAIGNNNAVLDLQFTSGNFVFNNGGSGEILMGTNTDAGSYRLQVSGAIYNTTTITTGAPTSGSAKPWRLGEAATVSPTSPNRTIRVEIDGTVYYVHAKTTND
jgi:hypothetical protein